MELRSYQREVIVPALEGKNIIIWLPTGAGKTRAAVYVAMRHLEMMPNAKVAMIVNKVHLVHQHVSKEFQPHLQAKYKIIPISGETDGRDCFAHFVKKNDVVICTAQILLNALLNQSEEKHVELSDFTLLIIDECHHTYKDAVYNKIMQIYLKKKLKYNEKLPQILGLTASPGTGGASSFQNAVDHILQVCANLDTGKIMSAKINIEDLEANARQPGKQYDLVPERDKDPFGDYIRSLMATIHEYLGENNFIRTDFGTQMYEQKVVQMENKGAVQADRRRRTCACHLRKYNDALFIHDTVRKQDAYEFLEMFYIEEKSDDPTDVFLCQLFSDNSMDLLELCKDKQDENPKLIRLEAILKEHFNSLLTSRGIIFTRTRQCAHFLHSWIVNNSTLQELGINSAALTGAGFSNQTKHMTQNEQREIIEKFRKGLLNLLVSTSVAEEGLDIPECNIVVRYGLMTNEISMVQARGRARAEDSCYSFLAKSGGRESRREMTNESLENLMNRAIEHVQIMPEREYDTKILELQLSSVAERHIKQAEKDQKKKFNPQDVRLDCRSCNIAVGHGSDFRVVEGIHHVNVNPNFKVYYEEHTAPIDLGKKMLDWVPGGAIRCKSCQLAWGFIMIYKGVSLPTVAIKNFIIETPEGRKPCKQWKDVTFSVELFNYNEYCEENDLLNGDDDNDNDGDND